jgi:hypothetical protein
MPSACPYYCKALEIWKLQKALESNSKTPATHPFLNFGHHTDIDLMTGMFVGCPSPTERLAARDPPSRKAEADSASQSPALTSVRQVLLNHQNRSEILAGHHHC